MKVAPPVGSYVVIRCWKIVGVVMRIADSITDRRKVCVYFRSHRLANGTTISSHQWFSAASLRYATDAEVVSARLLGTLPTVLK